MRVKREKSGKWVPWKINHDGKLHNDSKEYGEICQNLIMSFPRSLVFIIHLSSSCA